MPGKFYFVVPTEEEKAEWGVAAIAHALALPESQEVTETLDRNARHLQLVIDSLNITKAKRAEYQNLISTHLVK